jgi:hypothetical protein
VKYFILALVAFVICVAVVAFSMRRRREVDRVRRAELLRVRERATLAETALDEITAKVQTLSELDHVLAGSINPILEHYRTTRIANATKKRENTP